MSLVCLVQSSCFYCRTVLFCDSEQINDDDDDDDDDDKHMPNTANNQQITSTLGDPTCCYTFGLNINVIAESACSYRLRTTFGVTSENTSGGGSYSRDNVV